MTTPPTELLRAAVGLDDRLDELTRARIWSQLDRALDAPAPAAAPPRSWARRRIAIALVAAAFALIAALAVLAMVRPRAGAAPLDVPAGASARLQLGPAAAITLRGPARLAIDRADRVVEVRLDRGSLVGDYDHAAGGRMRIRTPDAIVDIVGTAFAVEVGAATCVSVAHGLVEVRAGDRPPRPVAAAERWCTDGADVGAMPSEIGERIAEHERATIVARGAETHTAPAPAMGSATDTDTDTVTDTVTGTGSAVGAHRVRPSPPRARIEPSAPEPTLAPVTPSSSSPPPIAPPPAAPPPPPIAPPPSPAAAPRLDAALYAAAERALDDGDAALADAHLARLIVDHPASPLVGAARFERARLAYQRGAWSAARASLEPLLDGGPSPLRRSARELACRIAERTHDRDAARCRAELEHAP